MLESLLSVGSLVERCRNDGISFRLKERGFGVSPKEAVSEELRGEIRSRKGEIDGALRYAASSSDAVARAWGWRMLALAEGLKRGMWDSADRLLEEAVSLEAILQSAAEEEWEKAVGWMTDALAEKGVGMLIPSLSSAPEPPVTLAMEF